MDIDEEEDCIKYVTALWFWSMALTSKVFTLWHRYTIYKKKKLFRHKNGSLDCMGSVDKIIADRNYFDKILSIGNLNIYSSKNDQFHENSFYLHHSSLFKSEENLFNLFHVTFDYDESEIDVKDDGKINENYTKTLNSIDMHERTDATSNNSSHVEGKVEESKGDDVIVVDGSIERRDVREQKSQPEESRCPPAGHHESDSAEIDDFDKDDEENCNNDDADGEEDCRDDNDANRCADTIRNEQEESHYLDTSDQNEISNDDDSHCSDHDNDADENDDIGFINNSNQANTCLINITKENDAGDDDNVDDIESSDDDDGDDDDAISKEETSEAKSSVASQLGGPILSTSMSFVDRQSNEPIERNNVGSFTNSCMEQDVTQDVNNSDSNKSEVMRDEPIVRSTTQDNFTQTYCSSLLTCPSDPRSRSTRPSSETSSRNVHHLDIDSIRLLPPIFFCTKPNHDADDNDESDCPNKMFHLRANRRHAGLNHLGGIVQDEMFHAKTFGHPSLEDKRFSIMKTLLDENIKKLVQASVAARHDHHHHHIDYIVERHDGLDDHPANNNTSCNHHGDGNRLTGLINKMERPVTNYLNDPFPPAVFDRCGGSFNGGSDDDYIETDDCREELENIRDQLRHFQELKTKFKNALETKKEMIEIINNKSFDTTSLNIQSFFKMINKEISELTILYHRNLPSSIQLAKRAEYLISKFDI